MANELVALRDARERTIAALGELFSHDALDVDEFERRLTIAHRASSVAEVEALVADFADRAPAAAPVTSTALVPAGDARERQRVIAVLGGADRAGAWTCPRTLRVVTVMGGAQLDFREARLPPGGAEVEITAVMGGVQLIVPPGLAVVADGAAVMGGFAHLDRAPVEPDPERPVLRVRGFAMMGGVAIETRLPGESERDAHRRRRRERRSERRALRGARRDRRLGE